MTACLACKHEHSPLIDCNRARRLRESAERANGPAPTEKVVHAAALVVHAAQDGSSRHGVYADPAKRREYRRAWAKADRLAKRAAKC